MKTVLITMVTWVLMQIIAPILTNLVSNQIEAWLPMIARRIVRRQAAKMGPRAMRCEHEWLHDLEQRRGGLSQLRYALGLFRVPLLTKIELLRNRTGGLKSAAIVWCSDRAWWSTVVLGVLLVVFYPPDASRRAAYAVIIPVLVTSTLYLWPLGRQATGLVYGRLNYAFRVSVGGLVVPIVVCLAVAWALVAPTWRPPARAALNPRGALEPKLVVIALPMRIDARENLSGTEVRDVESATRPTPNDDSLQTPGPLPEDEGLLAARSLPVFVLTPTPTLPLPVLPDEDGLLSARTSPVLTTESERAEVPLPEQPLPSPQAYRPTPGGPPPAPTNLRIVGP